jgi:hypothetical protein
MTIVIDDLEISVSDKIPSIKKCHIWKIKINYIFYNKYMINEYFETYVKNCEN